MGERKVPCLLLVVCLFAAAPSTWGAGGSQALDVANPARLIVGADTGRNTRVTLCHIPPDDPANAHTIVVGNAAVKAHLAHGDSLGSCPQACAGVPSAVPKTGQTVCWDVNAAPIDCAGTGQDGEYQLGASASPRFTDNADGTVKDNLTGLIWLKDANCFGFQDWTTALSDANTLASGSCGLTDGSVAGAWRLPNVKELESLIDFSQFEPALPPGYPFSGVQFDNYWSSTTLANAPYFAWIVDLGFGFVNGDCKNCVISYHRVWPVRGEP